MRKYPLRPGHPERICWGCEKLCPANDMRCGNGTDRAQHPIELWGEDWMGIGLDARSAPDADTQSPADGAAPPDDDGAATGR
ncbi:MAG: DUF3079 domain-containing protein [Gammaproteobacteria bacterium]|nr:DUF3079 domain-containing protein [Gammaproteobacteria bacterium]